MDRKPWADDPVARQVVQQGGYAEEVESDVGEHLRTRPAPGYTEPGGGRPTGNSIDNHPVPYKQGPHDQEFGLRDTEEAYAPPPPERAKDGNPKQPAEFEAQWVDRFLERTKQGATQPAKKLILPESYCRGPAETDIEKLQANIDAMNAELTRKLEEKERAAKEQNKKSVITIRALIPGGVPQAFIECGDQGQQLEIRAAIALVQALIK